MFTLKGFQLKYFLFRCLTVTSNTLDSHSSPKGSKQMITLSYIYYIEFTNAAGQPDCEKVEVKRNYETTDEDQAGELAMRAWVAPSNFIPGTLAIC